MTSSHAAWWARLRAASDGVVRGEPVDEQLLGPVGLVGLGQPAGRRGGRPRPAGTSGGHSSSDGPQDLEVARCSCRGGRPPWTRSTGRRSSSRRRPPPRCRRCSRRRSPARRPAPSATSRSRSVVASFFRSRRPVVVLTPATLPAFRPESGTRCHFSPSTGFFRPGTRQPVRTAAPATRRSWGHDAAAQRHRVRGPRRRGRPHGQQRVRRCAAPRPATPCSSTRPTSTSACSSCAQRLGVRRVLETHGHWDHIQAVPAVRDAGYDVGVTAADAGMLPSLRRHPRGRLGHRGRPAPPAPPSPPRATPPARCASSSRAPRCCSAATPSSPAAPATPASRAATSPPSSSRVDRRLFTRPADTIVLPGHGDWHHDRRRAPPPPGVGRPGLVSPRHTLSDQGRSLFLLRG